MTINILVMAKTYGGKIMNWLDRLEKKLGRFAIPNLMTYIVLINAVVYALDYMASGGLLSSNLMLVPELVARGELWRLLTFVFIPPGSSPIFIFFVLYFYYLVGNGLEQEWGSFRFNIYYFFGIVATIVGSFITGMGATASYLNLSLFLAFARIYPNYEILLFFVLPVKVKYLGWLNWAFIAYTVAVMPLPAKIAAAASVVNYLVFFGRDIIGSTRKRGNVYSNRRRFNTKDIEKKSFHRCTVCGITEKDDPSMGFRYCSKCEGDYEYCMVHLRDHEHIKKDYKA